MEQRVAVCSKTLHGSDSGKHSVFFVREVNHVVAGDIFNVLNAPQEN